MLDRQNPLYKLTRALIRMRKACYPLQTAYDQPAKAVDGVDEELAYWKLLPSGENMTYPEDQPRAMLVVLRMVEEPSLTSSKYVFPQMADPYPEGQAFVDLFDSSRLAIVYTDTNSTYLLVPKNLASSHVAIFAPIGSAVADDSSDWSVCKGVTLPALAKYSCEAQSSWLPMWGTLSATILWVVGLVAVLWANSRTSSWVRELLASFTFSPVWNKVWKG